MNELGELPPWWAYVVVAVVVLALVLWGEHLPFLESGPASEECWAPGRGPTPC